jgi:hypothetical protein
VNQSPQKEAPLGAAPMDIFVDQEAVLRKWNRPQAVYLIVEQGRIGHWQPLLTDRFHFFHQVATSGTYIVLTNQL